jgi:SHS2 domain-containing protein
MEPNRAGGPAARWHGTVSHTADIGLQATAGDGEGLLEEAAAALAELCSDVGATDALQAQELEIEAEDLVQLVFRWLNELIGLAEVRGEALARTRVSKVGRTPDGWLARGRAWFAPFDANVRPRLQVKAATLHRLRVTSGGQGWTLEAYLDV